MWVQCSHIGLTCRRSWHSEGSTWSLMLPACSLEIHHVLLNSCFVSPVQWGRGAGMGSGPQLTWSRLLPLGHRAPPSLPHSVPRGASAWAGQGCPEVSPERGWRQLPPNAFSPSWAGSPRAWLVGSQLEALSWQGRSRHLDQGTKEVPAWRCKILGGTYLL